MTEIVLLEDREKNEKRFVFACEEEGIDDWVLIVSFLKS